MATSASTRPKPAAPPNRRRPLLLAAVVVAAIVLGWLLLFRGGTSSSGSTAKPHGHVAIGVRKPAPKPPSALRHYAVAILPVLQQSAAAFDQVAGGASATSGDLGQLGTTCTSGSGRIGIIESQYDGVPHPWPFYTRNGWLHHQIAGTYHYMLGALTACETASGSGDSGAASTALNDMTSAAVSMHHWVGYVQWLSVHG